MVALASYGTGVLVLFQSVISLLTVSVQFVSPPATMRNPPFQSLECTYHALIRAVSAIGSTLWSLKEL